MMEIYSKAFKEYYSTISKMGKKRLNQQLKALTKRFEAANSEIRSHMMKQVAAIPNAPVDVLMPLMFNDFNKDHKQVDKTLKSAVKNREFLLKFFMLEYATKMILMVERIRDEMRTEGIRELENITMSRFGHDSNWSQAIAILAVQENLVKKKLTDLGVSEEEISKTERERKFAGLVELLSQKIKQVENRDVGLAFFKTAALREIRNKLEHEGYKHRIIQQDVSDLLSDLKKFDQELFATAIQHKAQS